MKRAQEMRSDEYSRQELRENQATLQELNSQIQELQDRVNLMNDSTEFQDVESMCSGKLSHVPSQPAIVPSPCGLLSRDQSLRPDTWNLLGTSGNVIRQSTCTNRFIIDTLQRRASLLESECCRGDPGARQYRETCC